jgi:hypothetical protein
MDNATGGFTALSPGRTGYGSSARLLPADSPDSQQATDALRRCRRRLSATVSWRATSCGICPAVRSALARDEVLAVEQFSYLAEAKVLTEDWRRDYDGHTCIRRSG